MTTDLTKSQNFFSGTLVKFETNYSSDSEYFHAHCSAHILWFYMERGSKNTTKTCKYIKIKDLIPLHV